MKRHFLFIFLLLAVGVPARSQDTASLRGRLVDEEKESPIAFASIYCRSCEYGGSVTNEGGYFSLRGGSPGDTLQINHIMYGEQRVVWPENVADFRVRLAPVNRNLPMVVVDPGEAAALLRRAYQRLESNGERAFAGDAFYRQITTTDGEPNEIIESFAEIGQTNQGINRWEPVTGRYGIDPAYAGFSASNFSWITRGWKVFRREPRSKPAQILTPLYPPDLAYFDYALREKMSDGRGGEIAVIEFSPAANAPGVGTAGQLYVELESAAILKMELAYDARKKTDMGKRVEMYEAEVNIDLDFRQQDGVSLVSLMRVRQRMRFKLPKAETYEMTMTSLMRPLATKSVRRSAGRNAYLMKDLKAARKKKYDPSWWDRYGVLVDTPLEKDLLEKFSSQGIMGNFKQ